ncbi:hypothetical protein F2P56_016382 [Juglans regia]|uniref:Uncharacterized protein LOC108991291 n=2 Tax=Juglans regia TaxID=51240 RepID=A0A2I4ENP0_JUGRE|nr:uncharacterized protein LOC108991291 [Juglans regia]KAF5466459.1 hypothetical protein F2P56_016382 [Juglans regia]
MSDEAPKLYANKPKKAQAKQFQEQQQKAHEFSSPSSSSSSMGPQSSVPPPQRPKESLARRYKFLWPTLLAVNLAVGAYVFMSTKKKDTGVVEEVAIPASTKAATTAPAAEKPLPLPTITESVKSRKPVPEDQQRELFKWLLEEKRKVKSKDPEEKKRIDEEKAILKRFIRAKSIPSV